MDEAQRVAAAADRAPDSDRVVDFDGFVVTRSPALMRTAWLLTGDWQLAEDLLQTALAKAYLAWHRIGPGREEAYVRRVLVTTYSTWWRRRWRGEVPTEQLPEPAAQEPDTEHPDVELRSVVLAALAGLPRRQRATVVLRYYCDLSEAETAEALGCSVGTVKSQAAKGLARLRSSDLAAAVNEGTPR
jgi:RNA polymerase sigma-70 factor (sigma-E family)